MTNLAQDDVDVAHQLITLRGKGNRVRVVAFGNKTGPAVDKYLRQLEREPHERVSADRRLCVGDGAEDPVSVRAPRVFGLWPGGAPSEQGVDLDHRRSGVHAVGQSVLEEEPG